eukprot:2788512-Pleurochrysis_carterae.AAC.1
MARSAVASESGQSGAQLSGRSIWQVYRAVDRGRCRGRPRLQVSRRPVERASKERRSRRSRLRSARFDARLGIGFARFDGERTAAERQDRHDTGLDAS